MEVKEIKITDRRYPQSLRNIFDPPKQLYIITHDRELLHTSEIIAVVGTRQMTDFGHKMTVKITEEFVKKGYVIISGMALGVDGVAHETAINNGGKTIAVLGAGVGLVYPHQHLALYNSILAHGGAIVSEHPGKQMVPRSLFAARNRIISGLSQAVVVVEGKIKSGSLITARLALDQGKDVFAVPGSTGTDYLIEQGAGILPA